MFRLTKFALVAASAAIFSLAPAAQSHAQVSIGVNIGAPPACPYGYYDYAPYNCAPYGYYGPEWFNGGVFIGAGQWFHGPANFHGSVNHSYDPRYGYHGAMPQRGTPYKAPADNFKSFHATHVSDGHGHETEARGGHGR